MSAVAPARTSSGIAPYLQHLRPAEWPVMAAHTALGWLLAGGMRVPTSHALIGVASWVVLLNGGTLALNSAFDRDEGDIAFLRNPPTPPKHLALFALTLMLAGLVLTWHFPVAYRALYSICALMSVFYSVPPFRLKSVAGMDWLINMIGFGTLTPWAGWAITGRSLHGPWAPVLWAFTPLFAALYPLTQLYQLDEDRARGDRTLALRLGTSRSLTAAVFCAALAFGMLAMAGWRSGWGSYQPLRWGVLAVAATAWGVVLIPWQTHARVWSSDEHQRAMYHALAAWALTDIAVLVCWTL